MGQWFLAADDGRLCFRRKWHAADGVSPALTSFSHRKSGDMVFQKREPHGEWQVFANSSSKSGDEARKLRHGDYVGKRFRQVEASLSGRR